MLNITRHLISSPVDIHTRSLSNHVFLNPTLGNLAKSNCITCMKSHWSNTMYKSHQCNQFGNLHCRRMADKYTESGISYHGNYCLILFLTCYMVLNTYPAGKNTHRWPESVVAYHNSTAAWGMLYKHYQNNLVNCQGCYVQWGNVIIQLIFISKLKVYK